MPYMQSRGDYLGGGYARGDPGLFGFLGGIAKKVGGFVLGGGIAGMAGRAAAERVFGGRTGPVVVNGQMSPQLPPPGSIGGPRGMQQQQPPRVWMGGQQTSTAMVTTNGCAPRGYHLAKDGSGRMVKNRSMNVANPKALRRAIRREQGFVKLAQRSLKGTGYKIARR